MNRKEPLFRVVKRESSSPVRQALAYVAAVVIALLIGAALLSSMDVDPLTFYQKMVTMGIPGNKFPWRIVENFVKLFVPLLITSLALSLAFRMRFWNIGGEGQFIMGAICAAAAAHKLGPVLPQPLVVLVMALCGILGGGLYGLIVALLIQPWTSQWMDIVSIYILPLGAVTAGIMFFWVMKKKDALAAAQLGSDKPIMKWFMPFGKYVFVPLCIACFVLGIWWGGIG